MISMSAARIYVGINAIIVTAKQAARRPMYMLLMSPIRFAIGVPTRKPIV